MVVLDKMPTVLPPAQELRHVGNICCLNHQGATVAMSADMYMNISVFSACHFVSLDDNFRFLYLDHKSTYNCVCHTFSLNLALQFKMNRPHIYY